MTHTVGLSRCLCRFKSMAAEQQSWGEFFAIDVTFSRIHRRERDTPRKS